MNEFQIAKEVFLSVVKYFLWFIVFNNLVWAIVFLIGTSTITGDVSQGGENNIQTQEVSYGK